MMLHRRFNLKLLSYGNEKPGRSFRNLPGLPGAPFGEPGARFVHWRGGASLSFPG